MERTIPNYIIVEFQPKYKNQVIDLIGETLKELRVIPNTNEPLDDEDLFKIPEIYSGRGKFWIALVNNQLIGTVAIRDMGNNQAKLNRMFVLSKYHGKKVGQDLLDTALNFARKQKFKEVTLNTHLLMKRAHHFYEKNGFQKIKEEADKFHYQLALE